MAVSYDKLWKLLDEMKMGKIEMRRNARLAPITLIRMTRNEEVPQYVIDRVCEVVNAKPEDIMDIYPDEPKEKEEEKRPRLWNGLHLSD